MTTTTQTQARTGTAALARTAAGFLDALDPDPGTVTVTIEAGLDVQACGWHPLTDRRTILTAAARILTDPTRAVTAYEHPEATSWGSEQIRGTYAGARVTVWTPLTRAEARALNYATCPECGHRDHDGDVICLAAGFDDDGLPAACECGRAEDDPGDIAAADAPRRDELAEHAAEAYDDAGRCAAEEDAR